MNNLEKASDPNLLPTDFKKLLDIEDEYVYQALDLNDEAVTRYLEYLDTFPEPQNFPDDELSSLDYDTLVLRAKQNDALAQFVLGTRANDSGNIETAKRWFLQAAQNGNMVCAMNYALMADTEEEKIHWLKKSGFKGFPNAQRELGRTYLMQGDIEKAKLWLGLACRRGYGPAYNDLGVLLWNEGDNDSAIDQWQTAAYLGDEDAMQKLADRNIAYDPTFLEAPLISMDDLFSDVLDNVSTDNFSPLVVDYNAISSFNNNLNAFKPAIEIY